MTQLLRHLILAAGLTTLAACSSVKLDEGEKKEGPAPVEDRSASSTLNRGTGDASSANTAATGSNDVSSRQVTQVDAGRKDPLNDPAGALARRSIYFDFDQYVIRDEFKGTIEAHAKYLVANPGRKVIIQGNTDERGSREYNLALGQKRAEAVRKALTALGVPEGQLEAVSLGEEKPRNTATDDASMAENRRADLVYQ